MADARGGSFGSLKARTLSSKFMELMEMKMEVVGFGGRGFASHACLTFAKGIPDSRMMDLLGLRSLNSRGPLITFNCFQLLI